MLFPAYAIGFLADNILGVSRSKPHTSVTHVDFACLSVCLYIHPPSCNAHPQTLSNSGLCSLHYATKDIVNAYVNMFTLYAYKVVNL